MNVHGNHKIELCNGFFVCLQESKVIVIQRAWRSYKAKQDLRALTQSQNPNLPVIRKFINLLEVSTDDFNEELRLMVSFFYIFYIINLVSLLQNYSYCYIIKCWSKEIKKKIFLIEILIFSFFRK